MERQTRTPEEIKKGLECCMDYRSCTDYLEGKCPYSDIEECVDALLADALAIIQQLEADLAAVKRERDAAVADLNNNNQCYICAHADCQWDENPCFSCLHSDPIDNFTSNFEWRGVCPENTEVQEDVAE